MRNESWIFLALPKFQLNIKKVTKKEISSRKRWKHHFHFIYNRIQKIMKRGLFEYRISKRTKRSWVWMDFRCCFQSKWQGNRQTHPELEIFEEISLFFKEGRGWYCLHQRNKSFLGPCVRRGFYLVHYSYRSVYLLTLTKELTIYLELTKVEWKPSLTKV